MFDTSLRPLKDRLFDPVAKAMPVFVTPLAVTGFAFVCGFGCCWAVSTGLTRPGLVLWLLNRVLDCLDGALARHRQQASDLGGFLDLLSDFIIYSAIPISCAFSLHDNTRVLWLPVSIAEASFHVNNFVLFYGAAVLEKRKSDPAAKASAVKELTSVSMRPALIEGAESGVMFTLMVSNPGWTPALCWVLAAGVVIGTSQRVAWLVPII